MIYLHLPILYKSTPGLKVLSYRIFLKVGSRLAKNEWACRSFWHILDLNQSIFFLTYLLSELQLTKKKVIFTNDTIFKVILHYIAYFLTCVENFHNFGGNMHKWNPLFACHSNTLLQNYTDRIQILQNPRKAFTN